MPVYDVKLRIAVSYRVGEFQTRSPAVAAAKAEQLFIETVKKGLECGGVPSPSNIDFDWLWGATVSHSDRKGRVIIKWVFSNDDGDWVPRDVPAEFKARRLSEFSPEERIEIRQWIANGISRTVTMEHFDSERYRSRVRSRRGLIEAAKTSIGRKPTI